MSNDTSLQPQPAGIASRNLAQRIPWRSVAIVAPFLAVFIALSLGSPAFLSFQNVGNVLDRQAGILIVAAASTLVIIAGGIDLSIGATYMFTAVICGTVIVKVGGVAGSALGITAAFADPNTIESTRAS